MLQLKHVTIKDSKNHTIIEDVSFSLKERDKVALIGEEGNGKSTLLKAIYDPSLIASYTSISGSIDMTFQKVGYLFQHLDESWMQETCLDYIFKQQGSDEIPLDAYNELPQLQKLCTSLRIPMDLIVSYQPIHTLSGGEKVKLQLLKLVYQDCDFYLLDEPTNDLDLPTLEWLEDFILGLTTPILFVSHDETLLKRCANRILHLEQRNKKNKPVLNDVCCDYETYVKKRAHSLMREEQIAKKEKQEYLQKKERLNDVMNAVHDAQKSVSRQCPHTAQMLKKKMHTVKAMEHRFEQESYRKVDSVEEAIQVMFPPVNGRAQKVILDEIIGVSVAGRVLLHDYHFHILGKDKCAIVGDNGCGKTQLMKRIYARLQQRDDIKLGYMPQSYTDEMEPQDSAFQFLLETGDQADITRSRELLGRMKFTSEEMTHPMGELSEGQKAKLFLLRFIKWKCNVLLLDEPTRNLSPLSAPAIRSMLKEYDGCLIAVTHDRCFLHEVFETIYHISDQRIQEGEQSL